MTAAPSIAPITEAIAAALATTGRPVGRNRIAPGTEPPYCFLTRIGLVWSGSMENAAEMATLRFQVTCVGVSDESVEWMDAAARRVLEQAPVVDGWHFIDWLVADGDAGIRVDQDDPNEELLFTTPQWELIAQPLAVLPAP